MRSARIAIVAAMLATALGCQSSDVSRAVGARCDDGSECDGRCLGPSDDYPGGFCSLVCDSRSDCPSDTTCADRDGGVCLFTCDDDNGCGFLGERWGCEQVDLRGGGIKVKVCRGQ